MKTPSDSEAARLEQLWSGKFGNDYIERNIQAGAHRGPFWKGLLAEFPAERVLEIGCNIGTNLQWIAQVIPASQVYGVDINVKSLKNLHQNTPEINAMWSPARELPFRDDWFDMVFTMGVLIHQPEESLADVIVEMFRCSRKYILCAEYFSEETQEVLYHQQQGALFKRNYPKIFLEIFPELELLKEGFLSKQDGWDDVSYWVFSKQKRG